MEHFRKGDLVPVEGVFSEINQRKMLYCVAVCNSHECHDGVRMPDGSKLGNGHTFRIYVLTKGNKITGEYIHIGEA